MGISLPYGWVTNVAAYSGASSPPPPPPPPPVTTTWDGTATQVVAGNLDLTDANLTVTKNTASGRVNTHVRATKGVLVTEKKYWEITINGHGATNDTAIGIAIGATPYTEAVGDTGANSAGMYLNNNFYNGPGGVGNFGAGLATGQTILVALSGPDKWLDFWFPGGGYWSKNELHFADLTASSKHYDISAITAATYFPAVTPDNNPDSYTITPAGPTWVNSAQVAELIAAGYTALG